MMQATGRLRYSPKLNAKGSTTRRDGGSTKWWLVIDCPPGIGKYYRELYAMSRYNVETLQRPLWEAHISIIRDEPPPDHLKYFWERYNGKQINFEYDGYRAANNGTYVWLPVVCNAALDIREELGLPRHPYFALHLTIGNFKNGDETSD
jgi:hypothetical protein